MIKRGEDYIGGFRRGAEGAASPFFSTTNTTILLEKSFYKMLFHSLFNSIFYHKYAHNVVCCISWKLKFSFGGGGGGGGGGEGEGREGDSAPSFWIFWIRSWD